MVHAAHEWLSVLFSAVSIWHLVRNWWGFTLYLRRHAPRVALVAAIAARSSRDVLELDGVVAAGSSR